MGKVTLRDPTSGFGSAALIAANNSDLEAAIENTLSRDGTAPNEMLSILDMNGNRIINMGAPLNSDDAVRLSDLESLLGSATGPLPANLVNVSDVGNYYAGTTVESVLQELGLTLNTTGVLPRYPQSPAELAAGATPTDYTKYYGDCRRFGASTAASAATNVTAINTALSVKGFVYLDTAGTYVVNSNLIILSDTLFRVGSGVTIQGAASKAWGDTGILDIVSRSKSAVWLNGTIDGNKAANATGRAFGIRILASSDVLVEGWGQIINCPGTSAAGTLGGDGVYLGTSSSKITLRGFLCDSNVRQGISVVSCTDWLIQGVRCWNQTGTDPGGGIDVEADVPGNIKRGAIIACSLKANYRNLQLSDCENILISGNVFKDARWDEIVAVRVTDYVVDKSNLVISGPSVLQTAIFYNELCVRGVLSPTIRGSNNSFEGVAILLKDGCVSVKVTEAQISNTKDSAVQIGTTAISTEVTDCGVINSEFIDCVNSASSSPVVALFSNSGSAKYNRRAYLKNNKCFDSRSGGNEANLFCNQSGATDAVLADYDIQSNQIQGPAARYQGCPNESNANFVLSGMTDTVTITTYWLKEAGITSLRWTGSTGTSNTNAMQFTTALPQYLWPAQTQRTVIIGVDNGITQAFAMTVDTAGVVVFNPVSLGAFTTSGTKGLQTGTATYPLRP